MIQQGIQVEGLRESTNDLKKKKQDFRKESMLVMYRVLSILEAQIIINIRQNFRVRTGTLMNSVSNTKEVKETATGVVGFIGNSAIYAAQREFGGTIYPKNGRYLMFPSEENTRADGLPLIQPDMIAKNIRVFLPLKKGGFLIGMRAGAANAGVFPLFFLKERVTQRARPYIRPALDKHRGMIADKFGLFLTEYWNTKRSA